jgi:hypothetical protein
MPALCLMGLVDRWIVCEQFRTLRKGLSDAGGYAKGQAPENTAVERR